MLVKPARVAVRLRRYKYYANKQHPEYAVQFTVRHSRPSGVRTEIHKIEQGDVDYILYGFVNLDESRIIQWFVGDLQVFREVAPKPQIYENRNRDSSFAVYNIKDFPPSFVVDFWNRKEGRRNCRIQH